MVGSSDRRCVITACQAVLTDARLMVDGLVGPWVARLRITITSSARVAPHLMSVASARSGIFSVSPPITARARPFSTRSLIVRTRRAAIPAIWPTGRQTLKINSRAVKK